MVFVAEEAQNDADIEKAWSIKAIMHAETHFNMLQSMQPQDMKFTPIDDEIYAAFRSEFPDFQVAVLDVEQMKSTDAKAKWRPWMMAFDGRVEDFNFGTLLRLDAREDYTEENSLFATRIQFLAIELARNREGHNEFIYQVGQK